MPLRWTTESPARTSRLRMSISISPSVIVGTIGRSVPEARRAMTIARASSSSGENGTVRMSSTPRSKARSFVRRSPRRVRPRTGVTLLASACSRRRAAASTPGCRRGPCRRPPGAVATHRIASASARSRRRSHHEQAMVQGQLDQVDDQATIVEDEGSRCVYSGGRAGPAIAFDPHRVSVQAQHSPDHARGQPGQRRLRSVMTREPSLGTLRGRDHDEAEGPTARVRRSARSRSVFSGADADLAVPSSGADVLEPSRPCRISTSAPSWGASRRPRFQPTFP